MDELKPCPFCGGRAQLYVSKRAGLAAAYCVKCHISTVCYPLLGTERAIAEWNTRAERTCTVAGVYSYGERDELRAYALSCGHEFQWDHVDSPAYCPICGAKVVSE